jgi:hypothetical protein
MNRRFGGWCFFFFFFFGFVNGWTESDGCGWKCLEKRREIKRKKDEGEERRSRADSIFSF